MIFNVNSQELQDILHQLVLINERLLKILGILTGMKDDTNLENQLQQVSYLFEESIFLALLIRFIIHRSIGRRTDEK